MNRLYVILYNQYPKQDATESWSGIPCVLMACLARFHSDLIMENSLANLKTAG